MANSYSSNGIEGTITHQRGVSSLFLKVVAIVAMTCNHAGHVFRGVLPFEVYCMLIAVGGMTFLVMAFLLSEGYAYTRSVERYALRLLVFAVISQPVYWAFLSNCPNVLFTLFLGLTCIVLWERQAWPVAARVVAVGAICVASEPFDWGLIGPAMALAFHVCRERAVLRLAVPFGMLAVYDMVQLASGLLLYGQSVASMMPSLLYTVAGICLSVLALHLYNGKRGLYSFKWFFYLYYPLHIAVLGIIKAVLVAG